MLYYITNHSHYKLKPITKLCREVTGTEKGKSFVHWWGTVSFGSYTKPTDTWKKLDEKFSKRKEVEKEKLKLKIEKQELVDQYDALEKKLESVMSQPVHTVEEAEEKARKISEIREEMKKLREKIEKKEEEIEKRDEEIEKLNVEINELADKVREEDHEANEIDKKRLDYLNQEKIKDLKSQL